MVCSLVVVAASSQVKAEESISIYKNCMILHEANFRRLTGNFSSEINVKLAHDLDGNVFQVVETGDKGYYIFDEMSGRYLEQAPESPSPYLGCDDNLYY